VKSTLPVGVIPDDSGPERQTHARLLAVFVGVAALAVALASTVIHNLSDTSHAGQLADLASVTLFLVALACYLLADQPARSVRRIRSLVRMGTTFTVLALLLLAGVSVLGVLLPSMDRSVSVQFSDITGRVQLEYCPALPSSFDAMVKPIDLARSSTLLPVWVSSRDCGNPSYVNGVWLYLDRSTITVADSGER